MLYRQRFTLSAVAQLLVLLASLTGCTSLPVGYSDFDNETDFSGYKTFAWISKNPLHVGSLEYVPPDFERMMMDEIRTNLTRRGFKYVAKPKDADFVVGFTAGSQATMRNTSYRQDYQSSWLVGGYTYSQFGRYSQDSKEGGIVIDIFDRVKAEKKWMGWSITELTMNDQMDLRDVVRELVTVILARFPPAGAA
jgi:hypothetical protein